MSEQMLNANGVELSMHDDTIAVIRLRHSRANAINTALLQGINRALFQAQGARGLIIIGQYPFFSAGLDLKEVFPLTREEMGRFMGIFIETMRRVLEWPTPTVAVLNGHALGGGFLLSLACDARIAQDDERIRIGFPEVETQVPLSHSLRLMALHALPPEERGLVNDHAENMTPREALQRHLVHEVISGDEDTLLASAWTWIHAQPPHFGNLKHAQQKELRAALDNLGEEDIDYFLEQWFSPHTRATFQRVWEHLS